jgi:hypothetical protein
MVMVVIVTVNGWCPDLRVFPPDAGRCAWPSRLASVRDVTISESAALISVGFTLSLVQVCRICNTDR